MPGPAALHSHAARVAEALLRGTTLAAEDLGALFGAALDALPGDELEAVRRALVHRCPAFVRSSPETATGTLLAYAEWVRREGGYREHLRPDLVEDLARRVAHAGDVALPLSTRVAYGLLSSAHTRRFVAAVRARRPDARELLGIAYQRAAIEAWLGDDAGAQPALEFRIADLNGMCLDAPGPAAWWHDEPVALAPLGTELQMLVSNEAELAQLARPERSTVAWLARTVGPGSVVVDAGANIGLYSALAGRLGARAVVSCEPVPANHARLLQNLALNGLAAERAFPIALGSATGLAPFGTSYPGAGSWSHPGVGAASDRTIGCVTYALDDLVAALGLRPTHLKIDVDGDEIPVLQGAFESLSDATLAHVLVEATAATLPALRGLLEARGFRLQGPPIESFGNCVFARPARPAG